MGLFKMKAMVGIGAPILRITIVELAALVPSATYRYGSIYYVCRLP